MKFIGNLEHALQSLKSTKIAAAEPSIIMQTAQPQKKIITSPSALPRQNFASSLIYGSTRLGQSTTVHTQPQFYSPMTTAQNWQIPVHRKNIYQWARYFYENEPKVAAAIDFYSQFSMNGFE